MTALTIQPNSTDSQLSYGAKRCSDGEGFSYNPCCYSAPAMLLVNWNQKWALQSTKRKQRLSWYRVVLFWGKRDPNTKKEARNRCGWTRTQLEQTYAVFASQNALLQPRAPTEPASPSTVHTCLSPLAPPPGQYTAVPKSSPGLDWADCLTWCCCIYFNRMDSSHLLCPCKGSDLGLCPSGLTLTLTALRKIPSSLKPLFNLIVFLLLLKMTTF